jgi:hypothetical protein
LRLLNTIHPLDEFVIAHQKLNRYLFVTNSLVLLQTRPLKTEDMSLLSSLFFPRIHFILCIEGVFFVGEFSQHFLEISLNIQKLLPKKDSHKLGRDRDFNQELA